MTLVNLYTSDRKMTLSAKGIRKIEKKKKQPKKTWRFVIYAVNKRTVSDMIFFFKSELCSYRFLHNYAHCLNHSRGFFGPVLLKLNLRTRKTSAGKKISPGRVNQNSHSLDFRYRMQCPWSQPTQHSGSGLIPTFPGRLTVQQVCCHVRVLLRELVLKQAEIFITKQNKHN